jgi:hypothetical protein
MNPLHGDHALLVELVLPICARYGLAIAGGYAIKAHGLVTRPSDDIDFATADASVHFSRPQLVSLGRAVLDDEFSLETLREQLDFAAMYPDDAFRAYGCASEEIAALKQWAQEWATQLGLEIIQDEPWGEEDEG